MAVLRCTRVHLFPLTNGCGALATTTNVTLISQGAAAAAWGLYGVDHQFPCTTMQHNGN